MSPQSEFRGRRIVEFADTDMAGILHFSNYFRYMESVEHEFFRSLGLRVHSGRDHGILGLARGRAECSYSRPLRYEDVVDLHLTIRTLRARTLSYDVVFRRVTAGTDDLEEVARGSVTVVCVAKDADGSLSSLDIPDEIVRRIRIHTEHQSADLP